MPRTEATVFNGLGFNQQFISREVTEMTAHQLTKTASRSVFGTINDFAYLADACRGPRRSTDLIDVALRLSSTPCAPLFHSHVSQEHEIIDYLDQHAR